VNNDGDGAVKGGPDAMQGLEMATQQNKSS